MNILVVDDSKSARDQIAGILKGKGRTIMSAANATDAFQMYQDNSVDIAFIDWTMPGISGTELCRIIRDYNLKTGRVAYLVLVAAKSKKHNMVDGLDAGVDDFVLKPFSKEVVLSRMEVARRVLQTKVNRIPKVEPLKNKSIEPVEILNREHVMIHKITGILEVVANMLGEGRPLPKKLLTWGTSSAFLLNWHLHEEKELFYIDLFIDRAQDVHGRTTQLYARSSLKQIMEEHELIKKLLLDMHKAAKAYDVGDRATALKLRSIIMRYLPLIRFHAAREEDVFLPFSQRYLTSDDVTRILADFKRVEGEVGKDTIDARMETVEQLEQILKIREKAV